MKKFSKTDWIICSVLLAIIILLAVIVPLSNKTKAEKTEASSEDHCNVTQLNYKDYNGKRIGLEVGAAYEPVAFEIFPDSQYLYFDNYSDLTTSLIRNKIDAFIADEPSAFIIHQESPETDYFKEPISKDDYQFGFQKDNPRGEKLLAEFNQLLAELREKGELEKLKTKWCGTDEEAKVLDDSPLSNKNEKINVAVWDGNVPFSYISNGKLQGYAVELVTLFAKKYGYSIKYEQVNIPSGIAGVTSGKYDIFAASLSYTEERARSINFSDVIYNGGFSLVVRASDFSSTKKNYSPHTDPLELNSPGCKIAVPIGSAAMVTAEEHFPNAKIEYFSDLISSYESVRLHKIDALLYDRTEMQLAIDSGLKGVALLDKNVSDVTNVAVGISRKTSVPQLKEKLNQFLKKMKEDGTLDEMTKRWIQDKNYTIPEIPKPSSPKLTINVGTSGVCTPYSFYQENELTGFDIELAQRFAAYMNAKLECKTFTYTGLISAAGSGDIDCIFANLHETPERKKEIDFSDPVHQMETTFMIAYSNEEDQAKEEDASWLASVKESFYKNFIKESRYKLILTGIKTTVIITLLSVIFGSILAFLICLFRRTDSLLAGKIANLYVKLLQGTPIVVLLMILYYIVFGKSGFSAILVAVIAFSLNFAAYTSEILRSGIESIDAGQREAALALGFSENQAFFRFIFPPAVIRQFPVYRGEIITLLKNTSVVGYIAIQDLTKMSDIIRSRTYEAFFPLIATAIIYFILAWIITLLLKLVLNQLNPRQRKSA